MTFFCACFTYMTDFHDIFSVTFCLQHAGFSWLTFMTFFCPRHRFLWYFRFLNILRFSKSLRLITINYDIDFTIFLTSVCFEPLISLYSFLGNIISSLSSKNTNRVFKQFTISIFSTSNIYCIFRSQKI